MRTIALVFDMDGLLTDTETIHLLSYQRVLKSYGVTLSVQEYASDWITKGLGIQDFVTKHSLNLDPNCLREQKTAIFHDLLETELRLMPHACEILHHFFGRYPLALASSSYRENVDAVLRKLDLAQYFDVIVSGTEVTKSKPEPDVFLLAASNLGVHPQDCLVLEDAQKGVIAANRAGMRVIAVPNEYTKNDDFSTADYLVKSLHEAEILIDTRC